MKRLSTTALYLLTALFALAAAAVQPEEQMSLDISTVAAAQNLFDNEVEPEAAEAQHRY